jgi:23S rRNA (guanosine2251-2'-O)-methyltransferase
VVIPKVRACEVTETVAKVSAGAVFNLPIAKVTNLKHALQFFKEKGLWVLGLTHKAEKSIYQLDLKIPLVLIVGNEGKGIRPGILTQCDFLAKIPMKGKVESLNVSVAAAIALFEIQRQRSIF